LLSKTASIQLKLM